MARRARAAAPAAVDEVIDDLDELEELTDDEAGDDLEELTDEPEPEPAPKRGRRGAKSAPAKAAKSAPAKAAAAPRAESSGFDSNWLASYVSEETGVAYDSRGIRMLLRKLAKDGLLAREVGTDRTRYEFPKGANDPIVKQVIKMVKSGEATAVKREGLDAVKTTAAAKKTATAPAKAAKATKAAKAAPAPAKSTGRRRRPAAE